MNKLKITFASAALGLSALVLATTVWAVTMSFSAVPSEYDPGHLNIITSKWIKHLGLADAKGNQNWGLLMSKNGLTASDAAAVAEVKGVKGIKLTELGFDIRHTDPNFGSHCGAGAPRFNVDASDGFHFVGGCSNATKTANTPQVGWTRVRIDPTNPAQAFPPMAPTATVKSISVLFDEGNDVVPEQFGLAVLDNIDVNGTLITQPGGGSKDKGGDQGNDGKESSD